MSVLRQARVLVTLRELGVVLSFDWPTFHSAYPYDYEKDGA